MVMAGTKGTMASQVEVKATMRAGQETTEANEERLETKMELSQEKMGVKMDAALNAIKE
jgi:hypothetical protein